MPAIDSIPQAPSRTQPAGRRPKELWQRTPAGRELLRRTILRTRPWEASRGPVTPEGKRRCAGNSRKQQKGRFSVRQMRSAVAQTHTLIRELAHVTRAISAGSACGIERPAILDE